MTRFYFDPSRKNDKWALPDGEVFELTAREVAEMDEDLIYEYMKRHEFRLASMNSRDREKMFDAMIEKECIEGGWFYWCCFPGCLPEGSPIGPFKSQAAAIANAQDTE